MLYYYGDHVPNFAQLKASDPAHVLPGYDYDVITEEALLGRASVRDGKIVLPDGMSYRVLVLPDRDVISLPVLEKLKELVAAGATVIGPKPVKGETLENYPECDAEIKTLADEIWGDCDGVKVKERNFGKGRVFSGETAREVLLADGVPPDFTAERITIQQLDAKREFNKRPIKKPRLRWILITSTARTAARRFISSPTVQPMPFQRIAPFALPAKRRNCGTPFTGEHKFAAAYEEQRRAHQSCRWISIRAARGFVVFREPATAHPATATSNCASADISAPGNLRPVDGSFRSEMGRAGVGAI